MIITGCQRLWQGDADTPRLHPIPWWLASIIDWFEQNIILSNGHRYNNWDDIMDEFNVNRVRNLSNKLTIIIIDACRGSMEPDQLLTSVIPNVNGKMKMRGPNDKWTTSK